VGSLQRLSLGCCVVISIIEKLEQLERCVAQPSWLYSRLCLVFWPAHSFRKYLGLFPPGDQESTAHCLTYTY
jgi:hypothetical protein